MFDPVPVPTNLLWTAGQVAAATGIGEAKFQRLLPDWEKQGFPRRIPGLNRWPQWAVIDWINSSAGTYAPHEGKIPDGDKEIDAIVTRLEGEYVTTPTLRQVA